MGSFNGFYQNDEGNLVDANGNELVIESDGSLNVNATITATEVEISNDLGNPIPVSDGGATLSVDDGGGSITVDGSVDIGTMPEVEIKNDAGNPISVTGTLTTTPGTLVPLGYEQITVSSTAVGLTVPATSTVAVIQNESPGKHVKWRDDGTDPTSTVGMDLHSGSTIEYNADLSTFKMIRKQAADAVINVSYYKYA